MDTLKKMFGLNSNNNKDAENNNKSKGKESAPADEFRKPVWYDEESDDELFDNNKIIGLQVFTNPLEMQKHFEKQMQEMLKSLDQFDESKGLFEKSMRDEYLKPGFEDRFLKNFNEKRSIDVDLDGEIYADQLHTLLQRISPELNKAIKGFDDKKQTVFNRKLSDEEKIWDTIHGNATENAAEPAPANRYKPPIQIPHRGGIFEGAFQGPKMFRQSIMIQTTRKPDGTYEIRRTVTDNDGTTKTTVTRDGKTETIIQNGGGGGGGGVKQIEEGGGNATTATINDGGVKSIIDLGRNLYVSKDGYALPRNLW